MTSVKVDDIIEQVLSLDKGSLMAKKWILRLYFVYLDDRPLLGRKWDNQLYIDCILLFGLRSAPKIFNLIADVLKWIVKAGKIHIPLP